MFQNFNFAADGRIINAAANFIRYEAETGGALNQSVRIRADGQDMGEWLPGDSAELPMAVTMIEVMPMAGAVGVVRVGVGKVAVSRVSLSGNLGASIVVNKAPKADFVNVAKAVTNASAQLLAANPNRQYLLIQNKDQTGAIWLSFGAAAATKANGLRIDAGGYFEWNATVPVSEVRAIGDAANNPNVLTVEG